MKQKKLDCNKKSISSFLGGRINNIFIKNNYIFKLKFIYWERSVSKNKILLQRLSVKIII